MSKSLNPLKCRLPFSLWSVRLGPLLERAGVSAARCISLLALFSHEFLLHAADIDASKAAITAPLNAISNARPPKDVSDLRYWFANMRRTGFSTGEISDATGMAVPDVEKELKRLHLETMPTPSSPSDSPLKILPYPGGRHPRVGFLEGAVAPQRETKVTVFLPWNPASYVVVDVPEAIFSNLGLTYLAHTHIPTIWDQHGIKLERLEWNRLENGDLEMVRKLPNGIQFGSRVRPQKDAVLMELWLRNGTANKLTGLRVQNCVMLKGAAGFESQTLTNKVFANPYAAARSNDGNHWIITSWTRIQRTWGNEKVPCLHADPQFEDCEPGEEKHLYGWLSFYTGQEIHAELARIESSGWRDGHRMR